MRAAFCRLVKSGAHPLPVPNVFVGVSTQRKMVSASRRTAVASMVKVRLDGAADACARCRMQARMSSRPGSWKEGASSCHARTRSGSLSMTETRTEGHFQAIMAARGPPGRMSVLSMSSQDPIQEGRLTYEACADTGDMLNHVDDHHVQGGEGMGNKKSRRQSRKGMHRGARPIPMQHCSSAAARSDSAGTLMMIMTDGIDPL